MKKTLLWPAVLLLGLSQGLTSCKDSLEIQPQQGIDSSVALTTPEKVGGAVVGIYAKLDDPRLYGTDLILLPELIGGDGYIFWQGSFQNYRQIANRTQNSLLSNAALVWARAYEAINQANLVIDALPVVTDEELRAQYEGEALFIRGDMYFELVRLYAQQYKAGGGNTQPGVPINLVPNRTLEEATVNLPRASVEEVYQQVIADLKAAADKLPATNGTRATKYTAQALLARVYLQQGNYPQALSYADGVIKSSNKSLAGSVASVFANRNGSETLFEIQQNDQNNAGSANDGLATYFASDGGLGRGDVQILPAFANRYGPTDARGTDNLPASATKKLIYKGDGARPGRLRTLKYRAYGQNIPVIRLAEMYLIRAETNKRLGSTVGATPWQDVNTIRLRSQADTLNPEKITVGDKKVNNPLFGTVTVQDVLNERQLELAFEGFHIYDLKRTNAVIVPAQPATDDEPAVPAVLSSDPLLILPIPQHDININPNLAQNPGY
ncbi:RagB/SusD family nutrient uptake outer membrane protein [Hymenobacter actinosclerus]|uniref:SusD family protein n=1 Tax=Hymenobacter actinosclerus TaxID=82805 RepID=A0A1I0ASE2_9BACT|nr:RagB/SusD family nutrient uptake outer membrane protein [Hymenobacter actinosclerus]SES97291.1 SusD family protein [Hymenobacter actinosclerus]